jgi:hypothetical protein
MGSRRILIGCGAAFLIALMLICAFSVGVATGEKGVSRAISTRAAQGTPANVQLPVAGTPDVLGTVQRYGDNTLTINTPQGLRTIALNEQTMVRHDNETVAQFSDLRPGVAVAVWGDVGNNQRALVARAIVIFTQK